MGRDAVFHERIAPIPSTAPPDTLTRPRNARAAWRATTSPPRRSTLPPRSTSFVITGARPEVVGLEGADARPHHDLVPTPFDAADTSDLL